MSSMTGQRSIKIISIEKTFCTPEVCMEKSFFPGNFFKKKALDELCLIIEKIQISKSDFLPWMIC